MSRFLAHPVGAIIAGIVAFAGLLGLLIGYVFLMAQSISHWPFWAAILLWVGPWVIIFGATIPFIPCPGQGCLYDEWVAKRGQP